MPETRYIKEFDNQGNLINQIPYEVSDEQLLIEQLGAESNSYHTLAVQAYNGWASLTAAQKDKILKFLLGYYLASGQKLGYFRVE